MKSPIVTLTTDWGSHDFFAGKFKGRMLSLVPDARIVDITHGIEPFNIKSATFVAKNACFEFPADTIHIIDVDSTDSADTPTVVVKCMGQYFVCADNGLPYALFNGKEYEAVVVDKVYWDSDFYTFAALDYYTKVVQMICEGAQLSDLGYAHTNFMISSAFQVVANPDSLMVFVDYVDHYGNVNLNISYADFERYRDGRDFELKVRESVITRLDHGYTEKDKNEHAKNLVQLVVSSSGNLQLAIKGVSVGALFGLNEESTIKIKFK